MVIHVATAKTMPLSVLLVQTRRYSVYSVERSGLPRLSLVGQSPLRLAGSHAFDAGLVIENMLWVGSLEAASDWVNLDKLGITSILTAARGLELDLPVSTSYRRKVLNLDDHPAEDLLGILGEAFSFLEDEFRADRRVLVHCAAGVSRSVSVCVAYLMCKQRMNLRAALDLVRTNRPFANPNVGFMIQLRELDLADCEIQEARKQYHHKLSGRPIMLSLIQWRNIANDIHARLDGLEIDIYKVHPSYDRFEMEATLLGLTAEIDAASNASTVDPVANTILKSAADKAHRLLQRVSLQQEPIVQNQVVSS